MRTKKLKVSYARDNSYELLYVLVTLKSAAIMVSTSKNGLCSSACTVDEPRFTDIPLLYQLSEEEYFQYSLVLDMSFEIDLVRSIQLYAIGVFEDKENNLPLGHYITQADVIFEY